MPNSSSYARFSHILRRPLVRPHPLPITLGDVNRKYFLIGIVGEESSDPRYDVLSIKIPPLSERLRLGMQPYAGAEEMEKLGGKLADGGRAGGGGGRRAGRPRNSTASLSTWRAQQAAIAARSQATARGEGGSAVVTEENVEGQRDVADGIDVDGDADEASEEEVKGTDWLVVEIEFKRAPSIAVFLKKMVSFRKQSRLRSLVELARALADPNSLDGMHMSTATEPVTLYNLAMQRNSYAQKTKTVTFFSMLASLRLFVRANRYLLCHIIYNVPAYTLLRQGLGSR